MTAVFDMAGTSLCDAAGLRRRVRRVRDAAPTPTRDDVNPDRVRRRGPDAPYLLLTLVLPDPVEIKGSRTILFGKGIGSVPFTAGWARRVRRVRAPHPAHRDDVNPDMGAAARTRPHPYLDTLLWYCPDPVKIKGSRQSCGKDWLVPFTAGLGP